jgi:hypothetical protein
MRASHLRTARGLWHRLAACQMVKDNSGKNPKAPRLACFFFLVGRIARGVQGDNLAKVNRRKRIMGNHVFKLAEMFAQCLAQFGENGSEFVHIISG